MATTSFYPCMVVYLLFFAAQCKMILQNIHHSISPLICILLLIFGMLLYKIYPYILTMHSSLREVRIRDKSLTRIIAYTLPHFLRYTPFPSTHPWNEYRDT